jgi:hypothetical protein
MIQKIRHPDIKNTAKSEIHGTPRKCRKKKSRNPFFPRRVPKKLICSIKNFSSVALSSEPPTLQLKRHPSRMIRLIKSSELNRNSKWNSELSFRLLAKTKLSKAKLAARGFTTDGWLTWHMTVILLLFQLFLRRPQTVNGRTGEGSLGLDLRPPCLLHTVRLRPGDLNPKP